VTVGARAFTRSESVPRSISRRQRLLPLLLQLRLEAPGGLIDPAGERLAVDEGVGLSFAQGLLLLRHSSFAGV